MKITVETNGHQMYSKATGEVIFWCQSVERFQNQYLQVPTVFIKNEDNNLIQKIPLQTERTWTNITYHEEEDNG